MAESWVEVNDASPTDATSGNSIGGISFGPMGSGRHTVGGETFPSWVLPVALGLAVVYLVMQQRKRR